MSTRLHANEARSSAGPTVYTGADDTERQGMHIHTASEEDEGGGGGGSHALQQWRCVPGYEASSCIVHGC